MIINDVSIIIVNYNTKQMTNECIESIIAYTNGLNYEIILVDNGSSDGSKEFFEKKEGIVYIYSNENLGFGRANNLGAEKATGNYLFLLNSDTLLFDNSIKIMCDFYSSKETELKMGALGCVLVDRDKQFNGCGGSFPTCKDWIKKYKSSLPFVKWFSKYDEKETYPLDNNYFEIDYVIGADLLIKKSVFESLQGFDPDYFMYYEESDLQKRMSSLGLKAYIITITKIIHLEDASGKSIVNYSNRKRIITHLSRNLYLKKNDAKDFAKYKFFDKLFLLLNRFNPKYSLQENSDYITQIKKTYS
ncbi:glycosyltransferase family 2 protein [Flavobacterium macacae]|uniref:Glycosyltransferase family 2 protein n=1 Tax=Flavobacterium macacae TaxID=2488993 RepID=A0A3P3W496_9FLAO|nr:glycosyltransferase family 2 protein [Flavobacterium macacae]RRJ88479.1 glycosyltransferase family 2 protein [Flavobacterium macacae]